MNSIFFSYGFRPFFFAACFFAVLIIPLWLGLYGGIIPIEIPSPITLWHLHEMIYGFFAAAAAGFILTAMPNWTGLPALSGKSLIGLFLLWVLGRIAMIFYEMLPPYTAALMDIAFLVVLSSYVAQQLIKAQNNRNLIICALFCFLIAANILMHLDFLTVIDWGAEVSENLVISTIMLFIAILGGRVTPAFTRNWLQANNFTANVKQNGLLDMMAIVSLLVIIVVDLFIPYSSVAYGVSLLAALLHFIRLIGWQGYAAKSNPLLWVLHLGYLWLCIGLLLKGLVLLLPEITESAYMHAIGVGSAGTMISAIITRATLGHTGRPLDVPKYIPFAYLLISVAAIGRIMATTEIGVNNPAILHASGVGWILCFVIITMVYIPMWFGKDGS